MYDAGVAKEEGVAVNAARAAYDILEGSGVRGATAFQVFIVSLILLNVASIIIESEDWVLAEHMTYLEWFETVSLCIFAGEYALRLSLYRMRGDTRRFALARFAVSPMMLVDLIVIAPLFLPFLGVDTRVVRILRILRLFAVFKLARMNDSIAEFSGVIRARASDLGLAFMILILAMILASTMMYYAERDAQPEVFSSISASMWWGVVTFTTIGYGDTIPITPLGRAIGAVVALLGIAVYAIPAGIMATAFNEYRKRGGRGGGGGDTCPHCGKSIDR